MCFKNYLKPGVAKDPSVRVRVCVILAGKCSTGLCFLSPRKMGFYVGFIASQITLASQLPVLAALMSPSLMTCLQLGF